ncbi:uncharacterized protein RJT21DRAFT_11069 [Scheffersomyces amazonensis]|uniref:uncharacterized protein n=1 Tax=Scheffersomyces amazonensis TaxID=1078765 RepID=UPI00315DD205
MASHVDSLGRYGNGHPPTNTLIGGKGINEPSNSIILSKKSGVSTKHNEESKLNSKLSDKSRIEEVKMYHNQDQIISEQHQIAQVYINDIFSIINQLNNDNNGLHPIKSIQLIGKLISNINQYREMPHISAKTIVSLTLQLNKLRCLHIMMKIRALSRSLTHLKSHIDKVNDNIKKTKLIKNELHDKLKSSEEILRLRFAEEFSLVNESINEYKSKRIPDVNRQIKKFQSSNFLILREALFNCDGSSPTSIMGSKILRIDDLLNHNILSVNQFFENLIILQNHLSVIFEVDLPYSKELNELLPNSKFYQSIKVKENEIRGTSEGEDGGDDDISEGEEENVRIIKQEEEKLVQANEKVVKLTSHIHLPLSSKSINAQRRASMQVSPSIERDSTSPTPMTPQPSESSKSSTSKKPNNIQTSSKKKKIIIPHRILSKPFGYLDMKDFSRFLSLVSKIILNFQAFFVLININCWSIIKSCDFPEIIKLVYNLHDDKYLESLTKDESFQDNKEPNYGLELKEIFALVYTVFMKGATKNAKQLSKFQLLPLSQLASQHENLDDWDVVSKILASQI